MKKSVEKARLSEKILLLAEERRRFERSYLEIIFIKHDLSRKKAISMHLQGLPYEDWVETFDNTKTNYKKQIS